jgi:hypothetical protein
MARVVPLSVRMTDDWMANFEGKTRRRPAPGFPWEVYGGEDLDLVRPKAAGGLLAALRVHALPDACCRHARDALRAAVHWSERRQADSGIAGYWYYPEAALYGAARCRLSAWTRDHPDGWRRVRCFLGALDAAFHHHWPSLYAARLEALRGAGHCLIPGPGSDGRPTTFTTATINRDAQFHAHPDRHNVPGLYEAMAVVRAGQYEGGCLGFPRWGVALDLRTTDLLVADLCGEVHCNTPLVGRPGRYERLSVIAYARQDLVDSRPP